MSEIQIFKNENFGEVRVVGEHIEVRLNGYNKILDEYDMLAMSCERACKDSETERREHGSKPTI